MNDTPTEANPAGIAVSANQPGNTSIALWAVNMASPVRTLSEWLAGIKAEARQAAAAGCTLLVLPEYACAQWLHFPDAPKDATDEIAWMADLGRKAIPGIGKLASETGLDILAGTLPVTEVAGPARPHPTNTAVLCCADGSVITQNKLTLTPGEKDPNAWTLSPGATLTIFNWRGWRTAIVICLDIEQPALATLLAPLDLDLVLVPSMTSRATGYYRVHSCARARAVELMTIVAVVGTVGPLPDGSANTGGAAVYGPCEGAIADDGLLIALGRLGTCAGAGPMLLARDLPLQTVRALRHGGAEVWTGPFDGAGVQITDLTGNAGGAGST